VFLSAGCAKAGADLIEVLIWVAGVADEFPGGGGVWRHRLQEAAEGFFDIDAAGCQHANGAAGGGEARRAHRTLKSPVLGLKGYDSQAAKLGSRSLGGA
jgi:hypothetical protein